MGGPFAGPFAGVKALCAPARAEGGPLAGQWCAHGGAHGKTRPDYADMDA